MIRVIRQEEITGAAYHEAGHAVAAHALERELWELSMVAEEETLGACAFSLWEEARLEVETHELAPIRMEVEAAVTLAGSLAEEMAIGEFSEEVAENDILLAVELAEQVAEEPERQQQWLDGAHERAEVVLRERWPAVQALAEALLREHRIDAARARALIDEALAR